MLDRRKKALICRKLELESKDSNKEFETRDFLLKILSRRAAEQKINSNDHQFEHWRTAQQQGVEPVTVLKIHESGSDGLTWTCNFSELDHA